MHTKSGDSLSTPELRAWNRAAGRWSTILEQYEGLSPENNLLRCRPHSLNTVVTDRATAEGLHPNRGYAPPHPQEDARPFVDPEIQSGREGIRRETCSPTITRLSLDSDAYRKAEFLLTVDITYSYCRRRWTGIRNDRFRSPEIYLLKN